METDKKQSNELALEIKRLQEYADQCNQRYLNECEKNKKLREKLMTSFQDGYEMAVDDIREGNPIKHDVPHFSLGFVLYVSGKTEKEIRESLANFNLSNKS